MADRSKEQIEAEIAAARQRLASNVEGLITQAHPRAIVVRGIADAQGFLREEASSAQKFLREGASTAQGFLSQGATAARAQFGAADGGVKAERMAYLAAAVVGTIALIAVLRSFATR